MDEYILILPLLIGYLLDCILGDPSWLPHPIVLMGKAISFFDKRLNSGSHRMLKGAVSSLLLITLTFIITYAIVNISDNIYIRTILSAILIFYSLAGKTLRNEVRMVFEALEISLDSGRRQLSRIVGRDTHELTSQEIKKAALETLAENLSDGIIAPLFWYMIGGVPAMVTYKMINTLDSMIGYRNKQYKEYGCWAARIDDVANYIPSRLTALLMILVSGMPSLAKFVIRYGKEHASPNSGYPEAALAGILRCRFGGTHNYFGESVYKPFIGYNERELTSNDMRIAISVNYRSEIAMLALIFFVELFV